MALLVAVTSFGVGSTVLAQESSGEQGITERMTQALKKVTLPDTKGDADGNTQIIIGNIINALLGLFGVFFLVLVIYGGYRWMNARGNPEDIEKAKGIIRSAIIGFILVFLAYAISLFVTTALQSAVLTS